MEEKIKRGFAAMDPEKRRQLASKGGKRAHELGVGHQWATGDDATISAGRKGGIASQANARKRRAQNGKNPSEHPDGASEGSARP